MVSECLDELGLEGGDFGMGFRQKIDCVVSWPLSAVMVNPLANFN